MIATLFSLAGSALAAPTAAEKETARKLVKSGRAKKKDGDLKGALEDFRAAHAIMGVPTTGLELGKAQLEANRLVEARDTLLSVARTPAVPGEPRPFVQAREAAKKLAQDVEPRIPQLRLEFTHVPPGAKLDVSVDGTEVAAPALSAPLSLNPGRHVVVVSLDGKEKRSDVGLSEGQIRELSLDLSSLTPTQKARAAPPKTSKAGTSPLVYVGFGVAGAGALVGTVTGVMALSKASSVKSDCVDNRCPPSTHEDIDSGRTLGTVSTIAFVVGGLGAGVGIWGLLHPETHEDEKRPAGTSASLFVGAGSAGVRGSF